MMTAFEFMLSVRGLPPEDARTALEARDEYFFQMGRSFAALQAKAAPVAPEPPAQAWVPPVAVESLLRPAQVAPAPSNPPTRTPWPRQPPTRPRCANCGDPEFAHQLIRGLDRCTTFEPAEEPAPSAQPEPLPFDEEDAALAGLRTAQPDRSHGLTLTADTYVPANPATGDRARIVATVGEWRPQPGDEVRVRASGLNAWVRGTDYSVGARPLAKCQFADGSTGYFRFGELEPAPDAAPLSSIGRVEPRHLAAAREAVEAEPYEQDRLVNRVAQALADTEATLSAPAPLGKERAR